MKIAVVANGQWDSEWGKQELALYDRLIAADGGANCILDSGYLPHALIGDLDSIKKEYLEACRKQGTKIIPYPCEKDETDLELALEYAVKLIEEEKERKKEPEILEQKHKEIFLLGATGGRIDHLLGNLSLMLGFYKRGYVIRMKDPGQDICLLHGQGNLQGKKGQKLSLIPVTEQAVVRTEGLYYPLYGEGLRQDSPRGISNEFLGEDALVEVSEGIVLVISLNPVNTR